MLASKPGLQRSTFLKLGYTGSEPSPAFSVLKTEGEKDALLDSGARCPLKCKKSEQSEQSELLPRQQKSQTLCSRVMDLLFVPKKITFV